MGLRGSVSFFGMRIVMIVLLVMVLLFVAVFAVGGMMLDKNFSLKRSIVIAAPPAEVHKLVGDLKRWDEWTPWQDYDDSMVVTLSPRTTGVGASQSWTSTDGLGELTFTKSDPATGIEFDLVFTQDENRMPSVSTIEYEPTDGGTKVTWTMSGAIDQAIIGGYIASQMDAFVGPMYEVGLKKLKDAVEQKPAEATETPETGKAPVPAGKDG